MMQTFTVPITPTPGRVVNARGKFFRYESAGLEGADQSLRVRVDGNDLGTFMPGDAYELEDAASSWEFMPATCSAVVKVGMGRITSVRTSIAGSVAVSAVGVRLRTLLDTQVTVGTSSTLLVPANANRSYLKIENNAAAGIRYRVGSAAVAGQGSRIGPGGFWEWDGSGTVPLGNIYAIGDIAGLVIDVLEG